MIYIGTAGWSIPKESRSKFPSSDSLLEAYAGVFNAVEINSSFYRPHQAKTYRRWAEGVPKEFRFSVKIPKVITHERRLKDSNELLKEFLDGCKNLGENLGPLLLQMPPSLAYEASVVATFLRNFRELFEGEVVVEPRHWTWFESEAIKVLQDHDMNLVEADPPVGQANAEDASGAVGYHRLHGAPHIYYSNYDKNFLDKLWDNLYSETVEAQKTVWCIFDNTALGHATENAFYLRSYIESMLKNVGRGPAGLLAYDKGKENAASDAGF